MISLKFIQCSSGICIFIKKYFGILISIFIILMIVFTLNIIAIGKSYSTYVLHQLNYNIYEYNEVDLEQLCRISNCNYVVSEYNGDVPSKIHISNGKMLNSTVIRKVHLTKLFDEFYTSDGRDILLYLEFPKVYFSLDLVVFFKELKVTYLPTFIFTYLITFLFLLVSFIRSEKEHMIQTIGTEAILSNRSMILITENVHHEMNTPLEVIDNKTEKIHRSLNAYILGLNRLEVTINGDMATINFNEFMKLNRSLVLLEEDFEFIRTSIGQINSTLDKMRGFKHLRYSNGNKTLYDIVMGALKIISISNSGFDYAVDQDLENYKIRYQGNKTLKNVDLLNIIINHLKNSLEAKSSKILIRRGSSSDQFLNLHIIDNGNGIPLHIHEDVFKPNFSTKKENGTVRGNGMYINRYLMEACNGGIHILDSNMNGTIIELVIPAFYEEKKIY